MKFIFLGIFLLTGSLLNAQVISHKVITNGGYHLASTIGEVSVNSYHNSGYFITQGFQQPSMLYEADHPKPDDGTIVSVYPNPVENDLIFELNVDGITEFTIEVFTFR
ncbi:MAG: hypothetical protein HQ543_00805 [Bacteroidetes bacterium]|nr:hypothetical protein [Bacteroidota bacterium]